MPRMSIVILILSTLYILSLTYSIRVCSIVFFWNTQFEYYILVSGIVILSIY